MKKALFILALSALTVAPAFADDAAVAPAAVETVQVHAGQSIYAADGSRLGSVYSVTSHGTVIVQRSGGRFISVAPATLSRQNGKVVTNLTPEQLASNN